MNWAGSPFLEYISRTNLESLILMWFDCMFNIGPTTGIGTCANFFETL